MERNLAQPIVPSEHPAAISPPFGGPAVLRGNAIYFTSWRYVRQGGFLYHRDGQTLTMWDDDGPTPATYRALLTPRGVSLRTEPAQKVPTGLSLPFGLVRENGRYRAWYRVEGPPSPVIRPGHNLYAAYAESEDAFEWRRPAVGRDGTNIVFRGDQNGSTRGCQNAAVFFDPSAPLQPYKMIYGGYVTPDELSQFVERYPGEADPMAVRPDLGHWFGLCGAVSSDGIHWEPLPEPLTIHHADTQNTCYYDLDRGRYVAYVRAWDVTPRTPGGVGEAFFVSGRRAIARSASEDFRHFSPPEIVMSTGADMVPSHVWYTNCKTTLPRAPDQHVMFPWRWEFDSDGGDCWLLSSADGCYWSQVPGPPAIARGAAGESDGAYLMACPPLFELPDGRWALYARGFAVPHRYPGRNVGKRHGLHRGVPDVDLYAVWPRGRVAALEAAEDGEWATVALLPPTDRVRINARVRPGGSIRVAVRFLRGEPVAGRDFADCRVLEGDGLEMPVIWNGETSLQSDGRAIILAFQMKRAALFAVEFW